MYQSKDPRQGQGKREWGAHKQGSQNLWPYMKAKGSAYIPEIAQCWVKEMEPPNPDVPLCPKNSPLSPGQAWESLEEAEYRRELALRNELIRQEKLEQLARRFDRKAAMRETWLSENQRLVAQVMGDTLGDGRRGAAFQRPQQSTGLEPKLASPQALHPCFPRLGGSRFTSEEKLFRI